MVGWIMGPPCTTAAPIPGGIPYADNFGQNRHGPVRSWPRLRTSPPPLYVNQTHEDWSLPAYSVFRAGRDPARHLFFRRGGNRKSQCRATGRPVGQRQSGAAFVDCVNIFTCNLRCKVPCSILHATLSFSSAHNKENSVQISSLQEQ